MLKRLLSFSLIALAAGCTGDSFKPNKVISDIEPNYIASGRTKDIEIHGDFTKWKETSIDISDIDFGAGITVTDVTVANEGFLLVTIAAANDAVPGPRDVEVDGEKLNGVFQVKAPFEVDVANVQPGGLVLLTVIGVDTDWLNGLTSLQGEGLLTDGADTFSQFFGQQTFTQVVAPNFLVAMVQVDLLAAPGPASITINGITNTDTRPDAVTIDALEPISLTAPVTGAAATLANGLSCVVFSFEAGAAGDVQLTELFTDTAEPYAFIVDPDLGYVDSYVGIFEDFGDSSFASGTRKKFLFEPGKGLYAVVFDGVSLDELFFDSLLPTGDPLSFNYSYDIAGGPIVDGTPQTALTLQTAGETLYRFLGPVALPWSLITATQTTPNGASTLDGLLEIHRDGTNGTRSVTGIDGPVDETFTFINGRSLGSFIGVQDFFGTANGATSEFDLAITSAPLAGTLVDAGVVNMTIPDDDSGEITDTVTPATGFTTVTAVHLALDISHGFPGDLLITLDAPNGEGSFSFFAGDYGDDGVTNNSGMLTVYPDIDDPGLDMDFTAVTTVDGTWTLRVEDTFGDFGDYGIGVLNGWAISIEGT